MQENIVEERKANALAMAWLIYDIFTENEIDDNIENGQNNANQPKNE